MRKNDQSSSVNAHMSTKTPITYHGEDFTEQGGKGDSTNRID